MKRAVGAALAVISLASSAGGQTPPTVRDGDFLGRKAWILENGTIRITVLHTGGQIAEIRLLSENPRLSINPMFIPAGDGYMGHIVCFPHFGPASAEERTAGLRGHGEAVWVEWKQTKPPEIDAQHVTLFHGADLPHTQYRIERTVSLRGREARIHIEEWVENLAPYDRPYNRNQHATFGAPFVTPDKNFLDMSGTKGITDPRRTARGQWTASREFVWPNGQREDGASVSLREFRAVPDGQVYTPVMADPSRPTSWFTLYNRDYPLLIGYMFPTADHPWIIDWQSQPRTDATTGTARGIEFGTSPFDEGLRPSVERTQMFGVPTYKWIGAKQRVRTTFTIFLVEIPPNFAGVQDVWSDDDRITIIERGLGRAMNSSESSVKASAGLEASGIWRSSGADHGRRR